MPNCSYQKPAKNNRAITQLSGWLTAVEVQFGPATTPDTDLVVTHRDGHLIPVKVATTDTAPLSEGAITVLANDITSKHSAVALYAFHQITFAAGYGNPVPVDRGPTPTKKLHFDNNFELVCMRHMEFRRVPNPKLAELMQYIPVMKKAIKNFLDINGNLCARHVIDFDDLMTYTQVWTCNFLGLFKIQRPTRNDNERLLSNYLKQRFAEFSQMLKKKGRNCLPDFETVAITMTGMVYFGRGKNGSNYTPELEALEATFDEMHEAEQELEVGGLDEMDELGLLTLDEPLVESEMSAEDEAQERRLSDAARRKWAQKELATELAKLPHDKMVEMLAGAVQNASLCYDARAEAQKQLRLHREKCQPCTAKLEAERAEAEAQKQLKTAKRSRASKMKEEHAGADARS